MMGTIPKQWQRKRHPSLTYETHPQLGYYVHSEATGLWSQLRSRPDGASFMLRCRERVPSDTRLSQWSGIDERLDELERLAIAAVEPPSGVDSTAFDRCELRLSEVRIEADGTFALFFDTPLGDKVHLWPMVRFAGWELAKAEWVP